MGRTIAWVCAGLVLAAGAAAQSPPAGGGQAGAGGQSITVMVPATGPLREAWRAIEAGNLDRAEELLDRAQRAEPRNPLVDLSRGMVAHRRGQSAAAQEALERALELQPDLTPAALVLGEVFYERGDLAGAIRTYEAALERAPGEARLAARLERWRHEASLHDTFLQAQGSHFTVLFEGPAEEDLAVRALDVLETAYHRISTTLLTFPPDPITVVLYTREQFRDVTRSPQWSGGVFDGRIRLPVQGVGTDPQEFERVLTHEFVHALVHSVAPRGVPTWLNEGLAGCFETDGAPRARAVVGKSGRRLPLTELARSFTALPPDAVELAYAESVLAVRAMIDQTDALTVMALLSDLAGGAVFDEAFVRRMQMTFADFQREYLGIVPLLAS